jgi:hypothetical protein
MLLLSSFYRQHSSWRALQIFSAIFALLPDHQCPAFYHPDGQLIIDSLNNLQFVAAVTAQAAAPLQHSEDKCGFFTPTNMDDFRVSDFQECKFKSQTSGHTDSLLN